jgi:hypothetical protein
MKESMTKGRTLVITNGRPFAKISPVSATAISLRGSWKGVVKIKGKIVKFNESDAWQNG